MMPWEMCEVCYYSIKAIVFIFHLFAQVHEAFICSVTCLSHAQVLYLICQSIAFLYCLEDTLVLRPCYDLQIFCPVSVASICIKIGVILLFELFIVHEHALSHGCRIRADSIVYILSWLNSLVHFNR